VTESVTAGVSGLFFEEQTAAAIERAIHDFERMSFDSRAIRAQAEKFNTHKFLTAFTAAVERALGRKLDLPVLPDSKVSLYSAVP
jgi:hypothetical protein